MVEIKPNTQRPMQRHSGVSESKPSISNEPEKHEMHKEKLEKSLFWLDGVKREDYPELTGDYEADIAIVGGGFAGLSTAYHLIKTGYVGKICILDKNRIGDATSVSAGLITTSNAEKDFADDALAFGLENAVKIWKSYEDGHNLVNEMAKDANLSCSLEKTIGLFLGTAKQRIYLKEEARARNNAGFSAEYSENIKIKFGNYGACVLEPSASAINPAAFCTELSKYLSRKGVKIFENSPIEKIRKNEKNAEFNIELLLDQGVVYANKVVLAGQNMASSFGFKKPLLPIETYCLATEPLNEESIKEVGLEKRPLFWSADMPYIYGRLNAENRLIFGGKDLILGLSPVFSKRKIRGLEQAFRKEFRQLDDVKIEHKWGGPIYTSADMLPLVGSPDNGCIYAIAGATGIAHSVLCGGITADEIMGKNNEYSKIFSYNRKTTVWPLLAGGAMRNVKRIWELLGG